MATTTFAMLVELLENIKKAEGNDSTDKQEVVRRAKDGIYAVMTSLLTHPMTSNLIEPFDLPASPGDDGGKEQH
eukprot:2485196-Rhodomonas_salina.1